MSETLLVNATSDLNDTAQQPVDNLMVVPLAGFIVWGFCGNLLVCMSISIEKRLQNMTNCFLFSLAVADLMVSTLVMPLSFLNELHYGQWKYSVLLCKMYVSLDVFLCSVSIAHMSVISLDRYWGISRPFATQQKTKTAVVLKITGVWLGTTLLASPIAILATIDEAVVFRGQQCRIFSPYFVVYGSTIMFFIPFIVMAFTYSATVRLLTQKAALCAQEMVPSSKLSSAAIRRSQTAAEKKRSVARMRSRSYEPGNDRSSLAALMEMHVKNKSVVGTNFNQTPLKVALRANFSRAKEYLKHRSHETFAAVANEQKATKVLGLVFTTFFVCWVPFFTVNVITAVCSECAETFPEALGSALLWLGYISSTINPIIYTTFNKIFRITFKRIICCNRMPTANTITNTINTGTGIHTLRRSPEPAMQGITYRFSDIHEVSETNATDSAVDAAGASNGFGVKMRQSKSTLLDVPRVAPQCHLTRQRHSLPVESEVYFV